MTTDQIPHGKFFEGLATSIEQLQSRVAYPNNDVTPIGHLLRTDPDFQKAFVELMRGDATIVPKS